MSNLTLNNYIGKVIYNKDPDYSGRCKIRVYGLMDEIDDDCIPWFTPINSCIFAGQGNGCISIPKIGTYVRVRFANGDIYSGEYIAIQNLDPNMINEIKDNYENTHVLCYDSDKDFYVMFQPSKLEDGVQNGKGFKIYFGDSIIQITPDGRIYCQTAEGESVIELDNDEIKIVGGSNVTVAGVTNVNIIGGTVNIKGNAVNVGKNASEPAVLGNNLSSVLKSMCYAIQQKMPISPGLPNPDMIDGILSSSVKISK